MSYSSHCLNKFLAQALRISPKKIHTCDMVLLTSTPNKLAALKACVKGAVTPSISPSPSVVSTCDTGLKFDRNLAAKCSGEAPSSPGMSTTMKGKKNGPVRQEVHILVTNKQSCTVPRASLDSTKNADSGRKSNFFSMCRDFEH